MRLPKSLSNSALACWETDRREYYLRYLCEQRSPKIAQTLPMAVGAAFDGLVKNAIERMLNLPVRDYGGQVEIDNKEAAAAAGAEVMAFYRAAGGVSRLLVTGVPRMEFSVTGPITGTENCIGGPVILSGKPDLYYKLYGYRVVHDWKVNGFCSKASPQKGYLWDSKTRLGYKDTVPTWLEGLGGKVAIGNSACFDTSWLDQETGYGWLLGEPIGESFLLQVHQITRDSKGLRLTEHRVMSDTNHQHALRDRYVKCWEAIHSGRCFTELSYEDDVAMQRNLDNVAAGLQDPLFNKVCGR